MQVYVHNGTETTTDDYEESARLWRPSTRAEMIYSLANLLAEAEGLERLATAANRAAMATPEWHAFDALVAELTTVRATIEELKRAIKRETAE